MRNNDILRRLRYTFDLKDSQMMSLFALAGHPVTWEQVSGWLNVAQYVGGRSGLVSKTHRR